MSKAPLSIPSSTSTSTRKSISDSVKSFFRNKPSSAAKAAPGSADSPSPTASERANGQSAFEVEFGSHSYGSTFTPFDPSFDPPSYDLSQTTVMAHATRTYSPAGIEEDIKTPMDGPASHGRSEKSTKKESNGKKKDAGATDAVHRERLIQQDREMEANLRRMGL